MNLILLQTIILWCGSLPDSNSKAIQLNAIKDCRIKIISCIESIDQDVDHSREVVTKNQWACFKANYNNY